MTPRSSGASASTRLKKLRAWLTISETANYLTLVFAEVVTEADVLRLGLDGQLKLSVQFVNQAYAKRYCPPTEEDMRAVREHMERRIAEVAAARAAGLPIPPSTKRVLTPEQRAQREENGRVFTLDQAEIYDLPMIGGERLEVEHAFQQMTGGPEVTLINIDGPFVDTEDGTRLQIQERFDKERLKEPYYSPSNFYPADGLPDGHVLVVRTSVLLDFYQRVLGDSVDARLDPLDKPLEERERATLLTIIGALASHANLDTSKPSKAAQIIEGLTQDVGARVAARTIENHLKRIREALERRAGISD